MCPAAHLAHGYDAEGALGVDEVLSMTNVTLTPAWSTCLFEAGIFDRPSPKGGLRDQGLALTGEGWGGHEDQLAEAFIGHAAEDALVQLRRFVRCGHDGWEFGVIAIVD